MKKIHDIELDGQTGPDGKFHATGVSLVENSRDPHTGIFVDDGAPEGDTTVISVVLRPLEVLDAMRRDQDPQQLLMQKLKDAGVPVTEEDGKLFLKTGILVRFPDVYPNLHYEWRSK